MNNILVLLVGTAGGLIGWRLKIAGGIILGSMSSVIIFKLLFQSSMEIPQELSFFIQVLIGVMVASSFKPEIIQNLKIMTWPIILSTFILVASGLVTAIILAMLKLLDAPTAYIATSPGAMPALIGLAIDSSANPTVVVAFHVFRLAFVNLTAPLIFSLMAWWVKS